MCAFHSSGMWRIRNLKCKQATLLDYVYAVTCLHLHKGFEVHISIYLHKNSSFSVCACVSHARVSHNVTQTYICVHSLQFTKTKEIFLHHQQCMRCNTGRGVCVYVLAFVCILPSFQLSNLYILQLVISKHL